MTQAPTHVGTASASGVDATVALSLISSEVGHEVVQALNYLRFLVKNTQSGQLAPEILGFAVSEIERLTRLVQHLRHFRLPPLALKEVALADRVEQTLSGLCDGTADVKWTLEVPRHLVLQTDAAFLAGALGSLSSHALVNAPPGSVVTVRAAATDWNRGEEISVEVVDCGPPLPDPSPRALFDV